MLRIEWASGQSFAWTGDSDTNPASDPVAIAVSIDIANLSLYLAVETDDVIVQSLRNKVNSDGLSVLIPYVYHFKNKNIISIP